MFFRRYHSVSESSKLLSHKHNNIWATLVKIVRDYISLVFRSCKIVATKFARNFVPGDQFMNTIVITAYPTIWFFNSFFSCWKIGEWKTTNNAMIKSLLFSEFVNKNSIIWNVLLTIWRCGRTQYMRELK